MNPQIKVVNRRPSLTPNREFQAALFHLETMMEAGLQAPDSLISQAAYRRARNMGLGLVVKRVNVWISATIREAVKS